MPIEVADVKGGVILGHRAEQKCTTRAKMFSINVTLRRILETPAEDSRFWQDYSYLLGTDDSLLDWSENPGQHCQHDSCWLCRGHRSTE